MKEIIIKNGVKLNANQRVIRNMSSLEDYYENKNFARNNLTMEEYYIWDYFMMLDQYSDDANYNDFVLYNNTFVYDKEKYIKGWGMSKPIYQKSIRGLIEKGYMKQWEEDPRLFLVYSRPVTE